MARMPGRVSPAWCPSCHAKPGLDCPDVSKSPRQVRFALKRELRREVAQTATASTRQMA
jgi:hypothetical protein